MSGRAWPAERIAQIEPALRRAGSTRGAAEALGCSPAALRKVCYEQQPPIDFARILAEARPRPAPPPPLELPPSNEPVLEWHGARPQVASPAFERRLVIGDVHLPAHLKSALAATYAVIRALQPHVIVQNGDLVNAAAFSHHGRYSPEQERIDLTMLAARGFIRSVKKAAPGARLFIVRGNHDNWGARWEAENPDFQGAFDFEQQLGVKAAPDDDRPPLFEDVQVVKGAEESPLVLGPVAYVHGNGSGMHFAKRYAETIAPRAGVRIVVVGHHHTLQFYRHRNGCEAWGCGWIGDERHPAFDYAPAPRSWWVGLLVEDVVGDVVTTTPVPIVNGRAFFGGRVIAAPPA